jgi:hypothetical protein
LAQKTEVRDVWGADQYEAIVKRSVDWAVPFMVDAVKALWRDGRPLGTSVVPEQQRLTSLLEAGPEFWDALKGNNAPVAAKLAANILSARAAGKIPEQGPRVGEAQQIEEQQQKLSTAPAPLGTERFHPIPASIVSGAADTTTG